MAKMLKPNSASDFMKMLWSGRFGKSPKEAVFDYMSNENVQLDSELVKYDILGSLAHVKMLSEEKILKKHEAMEIINALKQLFNLNETGKFKLKKQFEDVHMNVEAEITKKTIYGKKMHTARSRNDQIAVDTRLYMRNALLEIALLIVQLQKSFAKLAQKDFAMPAYTHTRVAQPTTISFWCESYVQSLERDLERIFDAYKKINKCPLGACAITGTRWKINKKRTAELLGFSSVLENEMDAISSRGELESEVIFMISQLMAKFSKLAEEIIWLSGIGQIKISDEYCTGSSIMPNKKNPDVLELIRGRTGRIYGNLIHVLTVQKGLMNGHNADTQETKFALMSSINTTKETLAILPPLIQSLEFDKEKMEEEIKKGYANATELADLLAMYGVPFRDAHEKIGKMIAHLEKQKKYIEDLTPREIKKLLNVSINEKEIVNAITIKKARLAKKIKISKKLEQQAKNEKERIAKIFQKLIQS